MDPDACLREARELIRESAEQDSEDARKGYLIRALDRYRALDKWLSRGGFLPKEWTAHDPIF